jgi:hypothetical protein
VLRLKLPGRGGQGVEILPKPLPGDRRTCRCNSGVVLLAWLLITTGTAGTMLPADVTVRGSGMTRCAAIARNTHATLAPPSKSFSHRPCQMTVAREISRAMTIVLSSQCGCMEAQLRETPLRLHEDRCLTVAFRVHCPKYHLVSIQPCGHKTGKVRMKYAHEVEIGPGLPLAQGFPHEPS